MANTYIKAAFCIVMSRSDASIVRDAEAACELIDSCPEDELAAAYERLGTSFKQAFPAQGRNVFASFYEVFDDPVYPVLDCDIAYGHPDAMGLQELTFTGEQFGVEQIARLLFACKSALPCAFQYSYDCDNCGLASSAAAPWSSPTRASPSIAPPT